MKEHERPGVKSEGAASLHRPDFDDLALVPARRMAARPAEPGELKDLIALAQRLIPPLAAAEPAIRRVYRHNPDSIWGVYSGNRPCGVFAMLLLNNRGATALLGNRFDASVPDPAHLVRRGETAAAVYLWAIATPGLASEAFRIVSLWLRSPAYARADIFTRTTTEAGERFARNIGFEPVANTPLHRFQRHSNRPQPTIAVA